ncbi:hypothetical protein J2W49_000465 [Hydrogenophaga palleronii]|uniref:Proteophosphoglycan ppg4 n=1 Tax=Hydrogenophaga palleronii TaxID=65655 RepID=A0ABU1WHH4_9BURK|nr:hypothetical protein [Hydrogenophaga palleronii]MDR7148537.1 hypothetical protein [Hydrogenophaga palleronii]
MLVSKYLTASLTALAVVGSASFVYAQTTPSTPSPGPGDISSQNPATGTLNQGATPPATGTLNQGTTSPDTGTTMGQGTDTTNPGSGTLSQGTTNMEQDRSMDERLAARADRN